MIQIALPSIIQDFITIFLGIMIEALPFLVIGVLVSVLVDLFVSDELIAKILPKNRWLSHPLVALLGIFLPVCECGNVPVARRLLMQGFSVSQTLTFLFAAPIVNPITLWSTAEAFSFAPQFVVARLGVAFVIAVGIGWLISFKRNQSQLLVADFAEQELACEHDHDHDSKLAHALDVFRIEFSGTFRLLLIGSVIAAATQTLLPRSAIEAIGGSPTLSILAMLALAFIVSICANIDAFFALAYVNTFTLGSLLTFLVFGPMIDIKILTMLRRTFKPQLLVLVSVLIALSSMLAGLLFNLFYT